MCVTFNLISVLPLYPKKPCQRSLFSSFFFSLPLLLPFPPLTYFFSSLLSFFRLSSSFLTLSSASISTLSSLSSSVIPRSAKDSILDRSDESFVQTVRDSVINSLEVEKQTVYAYSIWKDIGSQPGVLKRGMVKLRASFRRSRTANAARRPKLEGQCVWFCSCCVFRFSCVSTLQL